MEPIPYRIEEEDVDEVLSAYEPVGGGDWTEEARQSAREHVMQNLIDLDQEVRTAPESSGTTQDVIARVRAIGQGGGEAAPVRREAALAAIEDLLIRDGFLTISDREKRVFPAVTLRDDEHDDR